MSSAEPEIDGRTARRDRNRIAVLDAVLELFAEGNLAPSPDDVARRSGVSLRSVYRYVADADDLIRAAVERHAELMIPLATIESIGEGSFDQRLDRFLTARLRLYEAAAPTARASRRPAATSDIIRERLDLSRRQLRSQLELQFAPELGALGARSRELALSSVDLLTQIDTIDLAYRSGASPAAVREMLDFALRAMFAKY